MVSTFNVFDIVLYYGFYFVYFEVNFCSSYPSLGKCYFIYGCPNVSDCLRCQSVYPPFCIPVVVSLFTITPKHNNDLVRLTPPPQSGQFLQQYSSRFVQSWTFNYYMLDPLQVLIAKHVVSFHPRYFKFPGF